MLCVCLPFVLNCHFVARKFMTILLKSNFQMALIFCEKCAENRIRKKQPSAETKKGEQMKGK